MNPYDPGSTWKPVTAMAGMESGNSRRHQAHQEASPTAAIASRITTGGFGISAMPMPCALQQHVLLSSGRRGWLQALKQAADQQVPAETGIEIGWEESVGLWGMRLGCPRPRLDRSRHTPWIEDMASASIGQSVVQITPLQLAAPMRCSPMVVGWHAPSRRR